MTSPDNEPEVATSKDTMQRARLDHGSLSARSAYQQASSECRNALDLLRTQHIRLVWLRTALFFIAAICLLLGYAGDSYRLLLLSIGWTTAALFLAAIIRHEHLRIRRLDLESDLRLYGHLLARLDRNWGNIPHQPALPVIHQLAYADDLDLAGSTSLLKLISMANTYAGRQTLQSWLSEPVSWRTVKARQMATQTLMPLREFRLSIIRKIRSTSVNAEHPYGLPGWSQSPNWLPTHPVANTLSFVGPGIVILGLLGLAAAYFGENQTWVNVSAICLGVGFLINILVTVFWGSWIHDIFQKVTGEHRAVYQFASVFRSLGELPCDPQKDTAATPTAELATAELGTSKSESSILCEIKRRATESPKSATMGFAKLMNIVRLANFQRDPVLYLVYLVLQLFFLWDFRVLRLLESWKSQFGAEVGGWFDALGQCEALISSATLADEYRDWCYPLPPENESTYLFARALGHPLLKDQDRVVNDLQIQDQKPLVVVTGSNMAGKSTFLRAIGLNVVLSRTGAPVCGETLRIPSFELATSIRIRDSLSDGVSFFMAELKRLKEVVDLAQKHHQLAKTDPDTPKILFLLDEILQGTNSQERQIAVATVLQQLLDSRATGLVSTHDLDLAHAPEVQDISQTVHFREYFEQQDGREVMRFDYRMRPGPTPTTNALKLLQLVGLDKNSTPPSADAS
ncbi:MAG: hypothetical protein NXI32_18855 [bacterium]|nr:hypothetical protein [bacterium]